MTEAVETIKGRKLDARYTLVDKLGAGGQGEVWRAHDGTRGVDIALKVVKPTGREEEAWSALEHEYAIASRLDHPSILKIFPPERSGDAMILPMELASGGDLRRLRGAGFLEIIPALLEIAQALEHAHERGVVHRDLKPGNVLFDARGRARLADFGVAEQAMTSLEANSGSLSTAPGRDTNRHGFSPFTASPAQLRGEPPTPVDDIYGLGALAYELLSGYPPYYPHFDKKRAIEERVPTLVPTRQIPPLLGTLVMNMLAKDPKQRPRTMREVIDELDAAINDTLTFDFESVSPATPAASRAGSPEGTVESGASQAQHAPAGSTSNALDASDRASSWTPESQDRRLSTDRRGRRKEDLAPTAAREPADSSDLSDIPRGQRASDVDAPAGPDSISTSASNVRADRPAADRNSSTASAVVGPNSATGAAPQSAPGIGPNSSAHLPPRRTPRSGADALARIDAALARAAAAGPARAEWPLREEGPPSSEGELHADRPLRADGPRRAEGPLHADGPRRAEGPLHADAPRRAEGPLHADGQRRADGPLQTDGPRRADGPPRGEGVPSGSSRPRGPHSGPMTPETAAALVAAARAAGSKPIAPQPHPAAGRPGAGYSAFSTPAASRPLPTSTHLLPPDLPGTLTDGPAGHSPPPPPEHAPSQSPVTRAHVPTTPFAPGQAPGMHSSSGSSHALGMQPPAGSGHALGMEPAPGSGHARGMEPTPGSGHARGMEPTPGLGRAPGMEPTPGSGRAPGMEPTPGSGHAPAMQSSGLGYGSGAQSPPAFAHGQSPAAPHPASTMRGTYSHAITAHGPMHATWEIPLDGLPKVARLQPIRPRRWPWVFLGLVAGAAAAVYFWLPRFDTRTLPPEVAAVVAPLQAALTPPTPSSQAPTAPVAPAATTSTSSSADGSGSTVPQAAVPPAGAVASTRSAALAGSASNTSAGSLPNTSAGDEQRWHDMRQTFENRLAMLESRGAGAWGVREFAMAKIRAAESVGARDAGNPRMAQERLSAAMKLLDTVESRAPQALSAQVAAGEKALGTGQQEVAGQAFDLAHRINPADRRASDGQRRAQNLNAVLPLLADAQNAESAHDYARAAQDYSQALFLDPGNTTARAGQARSNAAFGDDNYAKAVGSGFAALGAGRLDEAHESFVKARALKPNGAEASEGLRRVSAALSARGFASMRQRALGLEAQERWEEALQVYEDVLAADPSLAFAQEGKARTSSRADLSIRLQQLLDRPDRLSSPSVREDASALLETARAQSPQGPVIRSQIARLEIALPGFDKPVRLSLLSDNSTQIVIPSIGSFGTFARRDIELRPGKYTVVGTRNGFRDVRREITVAPGQETQTIRVTCSDPI